MTELRELIQRINENPASMTDVDWKEATSGFSQKCMEELVEGISDLEVMKEVAELIKLRHKRAVKEVDECLFVHYAPDAKIVDDDGVTHPNPDAGKPEWNVPVEYYIKEWVYYGNRRYLEWIEHDIYHFLDIIIEKRALELETQTKKETIRRKYSGQDVARCNATPPPVESDEREEKTTLQNVQRNVFTDDDAKAIWKKLIDLGYIDEDIKPVKLSLSKMRAVVKAFYYAWDKENLSWVPFRERWGRDLQHARDSQESEKLFEQLMHQL